MPGGAGSVFRRIGDAEFEPTLSAVVYGCRPLGAKRFVHYRYSFELIFPKEIETVTFGKQSVSLKVVKNFIGAEETDENSESWDLSVHHASGDVAKDNTRVEVLRKRVVSRLFRFMPPPRPRAKGKKPLSPERWLERALKDQSRRTCAVVKPSTILAFGGSGSDRRGHDQGRDLQHSPISSKSGQDIAKRQASKRMAPAYRRRYMR